MCSGCQDGGSPYDQEQTFGRLSPFSMPMFGSQMPVRRRHYQTRSVNRLLAPEGAESLISRMWPVEREQTYSSVYYRQEDRAADEPVMMSRPAVDLSREPVEILVSRHAIVELYRGGTRKDRDAQRALRRASDGWGASVGGRLRKVLLVGFWLLAAYGAWCVVGPPLAAGAPPHRIVRARSSDVRRGGASSSR